MGVLVLMMTIIFVNAQDFKKVQTSVIIGKFEAAKEEYDKAVAKKASMATSPEGYFWKARIYSGLDKDATLAGKYPTAYAELRAALGAYMTLDTSFAIAKENGQEPFFDVYMKSFKDGVAAFNVKNWKVAATSFDEAVIFSDIIFSRGWATSKQKFDTTSIIYAGYSNQNAANVDKANEQLHINKTAGYYKRLVDYKINTPELLDIYRYLLIQLIAKKDKTVFDNYLKVAQGAYPAETWVEYKNEYIEKNYTSDEKIKLFDDQAAANSLTEVEAQSYGDMFMSAKNAEGLTPEATQKFIIKAAEAYKKAYTINPTNFAAAFNVGISYYNQYTILDEKLSQNIKSLQTMNMNKPANTPKDPKKKAAFEITFKAQTDSIKKLNVSLDAPIKEHVDAAIEWIEKAYAVVKDKPKLTKAERNVASRSVDFLATLYSFKRDKARGKDQKASDAYDAKFIIYDNLHSKYQ